MKVMRHKKDNSIAKVLFSLDGKSYTYFPFSDVLEVEVVRTTFAKCDGMPHISRWTRKLTNEKNIADLLYRSGAMVHVNSKSIGGCL